MGVSQGRDNYAAHARGLSLAGAGALQHRAGLLRALGAASADATSRVAIRAAWGAALQADSSPTRAAGCRQPRQRPAGARSACAARRPRGHRDAAALRNRDRLHGGVPAGRGGDAAVDAVRARGAGVPAAATARPCVAICDESSIASVLAVRAQVPGAAHVVGVGAPRPRGSIDWDAALHAPRSAFAAVADERRRRRGADLHQRHHRPAQGRVACRSAR